MFHPETTLGRIVRYPLRAVPRNAVVPVLSGPNRGRLWKVGAGNHGCWLGSYERQEMTEFLVLVGPTDTVWDIGAHAGYFTLACAGRARHVVACEAAQDNANNLRLHLRLNHVSNVSVVEAAICDRHRDTERFGGGDSYQGRIGGGTTLMQTATIDGLVADGVPPPTIIKMDIEGAEVAALAGAATILRDHKPALLLAVHGKAIAEQCITLLGAAGYQAEWLNVGTIWADHVALLEARKRH